MKPLTSHLCDQVSGRLVAGESLSDHPELAAHVGSCLQCFRMAGDLREVPRIERVLRQSRPAIDIDPGDAFWAKFPDTVVTAWERSRLQKTGRNNADPARARVLDVLRAWFRLPVPAAAAGAALAGILVFLLVRRDPGEGRGPLRPVTAASDVGEPKVLASGAATADVSVLDITNGDEEPVEFEQNLVSLEVADLNKLLTAMEDEQHASFAGRRPLEAEESEPAVSIADEIEILGTDELKELDQALRRSSRI